MLRRVAERVAERPRPPRHRIVDALLRVAILEDRAARGLPPLERKCDRLACEQEGLPMREVELRQACQRITR